jgi:hypothetical protein
MKKLTTILILMIYFSFTISLYAENKIFYADLDGDKKNEQIIISIKDDGKIEFLHINKYNKIIFSHKDFDNLQFEYAKTIKFKGITDNASRDVFFLLLGGCNTYLYVISYDTKYLNDGGKNIKNYSVKKQITQIDSCY